MVHKTDERQEDYLYPPAYYLKIKCRTRQLSLNNFNPETNRIEINIVFEVL